jgi:hypothetical protein
VIIERVLSVMVASVVHAAADERCDDLGVPSCPNQSVQGPDEPSPSTATARTELMFPAKLRDEALIPKRSRRAVGEAPGLGVHTRETVRPSAEKDAPVGLDVEIALDRANVSTRLSSRAAYCSPDADQLVSAGIAVAARIPVTVTTTISSINVKACGDRACIVHSSLAFKVFPSEFFAVVAFAELA